MHSISWQLFEIYSSSGEVEHPLASWIPVIPTTVICESVILQIPFCTILSSRISGLSFPLRQDLA